jgi:hypothetical protein
MPFPICMAPLPRETVAGFVAAALALALTCHKIGSGLEKPKRNSLWVDLQLRTWMSFLRKHGSVQFVIMSLSLATFLLVSSCPNPSAPRTGGKAKLCRDPLVWTGVERRSSSTSSSSSFPDCASDLRDRDGQYFPTGGQMASFRIVPPGWVRRTSTSRLRLTPPCARALPRLLPKQLFSASCSPRHSLICSCISFSVSGVTCDVSSRPMEFRFLSSASLFSLLLLQISCSSMSAESTFPMSPGTPSSARVTSSPPANPGMSLRPSTASKHSPHVAVDGKWSTSLFSCRLGPLCKSCWW